jgi:hypothetical protein
MIPPLHQSLLAKLAEASELSEDVRFGQLLDFLGFLASAKANQSLAEIDDAELLEVVEQHCTALRIRKPEALARRA